MSAADFVALAPLVVVAGAALAALLVSAFTRSRWGSAAVAVLGLAGALASLPWAATRAPRQVTPLMRIDGLTLTFGALVLGAALAVALLAHGYLERREVTDSGELYTLLLIATLGALVLVASDHLVSLFLGLETLSVGLYVLVAYLREDGERPVEAGLKYLVLAGASSAFLLFGMALLYAAFGTLGLSGLASWAAATGGGGALPVAGLALILVGLGFKLALVPFHLWTPDVYQGAPAPVSAFVATASKGAVAGLLLRWSAALGPALTGLTGSGAHGGGASATGAGPLFVLLAPVAVASMLAGNLLALLQDDLKRLLAYSSIAHLGYLLVALLAGGSLAREAVTFYLVAYFVSLLAAFGVVSVLSGPAGEAEAVADYRGLFWRRPWLAALLTGSLLSLAGIPLTAGFPGKLYVVTTGVRGAHWVLVLVLVGTSAVGLYYYLRVILAMAATSEERRSGSGSGPGTESGTERVPAASGVVLAALGVLLLGLGVWPAPAIRWIRAARTPQAPRVAASLARHLQSISYGETTRLDISNDERRQLMNWNQIEGNWKQVRGEFEQKWGKLTGDDLQRAKGVRDKLIGAVEERYGVKREEAEKQLDAFVDQLTATSSEQHAVAH